MEKRKAVLSCHEGMKERRCFEEIFKKYDCIIFLDTETTGFSPVSCRAIELAAMRVEQGADGALLVTDAMDLLIKMPEGEQVPAHIKKLTGITDSTLEKEGVPEKEAAERFAEMLQGYSFLLAAHNVPFDYGFISKIFERSCEGKKKLLKDVKYLDSLTVFRARRDGSHSLANAIRAYGLTDRVKNSHRASDDAEAVFEICKAMDAEQADLHEYIATNL